MARNLPHKSYNISNGERTIAADWESTDFTNPGYTRIQVYIDISAITDTPSVAFQLQGKDLVSGEYYVLAATAAQTGVASLTLTLGPGQNEVDDDDTGVTSVNGFLPRIWRLAAVGTWAGTDDITFTAGGSAAV